MKYGVYTSVTGKVRSHTLAPLIKHEEYINDGYTMCKTCGGE